ncbi:helix-turn-helix domain-containing protein [Mycolicibacterium sp. lyk4-40-TYG-92]|uniref:helix-turn-helix domain-containing protein n=1 Tax=Mycolicibacterium sp. lyk4-40-TYG-92 TaxID=3040295 RepID=UPI002550D6A7|nr:helix-turn-helix domain-containing protein [Mycolicibacterium sp. lyk4-40-TYG-92]
MGSDTELLVTVEEAQRRLGGISKPTLYKRIAAGQIVKVNIGRRVFVTVESLTAYVDLLKDAGGAA